jgi:hypothetical protein
MAGPIGALLKQNMKYKPYFRFFASDILNLFFIQSQNFANMFLCLALFFFFLKASGGA